MPDESAVPYRVEQSNNRHSRAMFRDGQIVIRLAKRLTEKQRQEHIASLLRRMQRQLQNQPQRTIIKPFAACTKEGKNSSTLPCIGHAIQYQLGSTTSLKKKERVITIDQNLTTEERDKAAWQLTAKLLLPTATDYVRYINEISLQVEIAAVRVRHATSQWGSCSSKGNIMLNTALFFTSTELLQYVTIHELAHRIHQDHSPRFWRLVEEACEYTAEARSALKQYRLS